MQESDSATPLLLQSGTDPTLPSLKGKSRVDKKIGDYQDACSSRYTRSTINKTRAYREN